MARLFGTDGVRGLANVDLTAPLALELGEAAARLTIQGRPASGHKPKAIIGRDTRISGEFLDHALAAGLASAGMDVVRVGVVTTPTVAHLTASSSVDLGVMISASHNPMPDNGIKFFAHGGYKLPDQVEDQIQELLNTSWDRPTGAAVGEVEYDDDWAEKSYIEHLMTSLGTDLHGLRIAVDCANGGASFLAPEAFRQAGADAVVINAAPDGRNINDKAGSTHPEQLQAAVVASGADFGMAFDGDADRCLAVDAEGRLVDGDQIMGLLAIAMKARGELDSNALVVTVMSNLGLILAMREAGIATVQTAVGDRYVLEAMRENGYNLGGEQSGHVIMSDYATTGDGVLTGLHLAAEVARSGKKLSELAARMKPTPQRLINVKNVDRAGVKTNKALTAAVTDAEKTLGHSGRVLLRASGTEPLVRVMVEAAAQQQADEVAQQLADVVTKELKLV